MELVCYLAFVICNLFFLGCPPLHKLPNPSIIKFIRYGCLLLRPFQQALEVQLISPLHHYELDLFRLDRPSNRMRIHAKQPRGFGDGDSDGVNYGLGGSRIEHNGCKSQITIQQITNKFKGSKFKIFKISKLDLVCYL